ncbi:MAG TPA: DNA mismatch repair protein, partial [Polyangiaceae bacterium LLY-WYZ-15_(1-7)]|nr:DNA mismatch repair protein [Polyangiaceae bacterium LLY-WYZ-15_(1-7)]
MRRPKQRRLLAQRRRLHRGRIGDTDLPALPPGEESAPEEWIDLIHHTPQLQGSTDRLRRALRFAFESGDAGGLLRLLVDQAPLSPSTWSREAFEAGLFLPELVAETFSFTLDGARFVPSQAHLTRVLTQPPADGRDVVLRQEVLRELSEDDALRASLSRAYATLRRLRALLDEEPMTPGETVRRKLEVLTAIRTFFDECDEGLGGARSALGRLAAHAREAKASPVWKELLQVLAFDGHLASIELRVVVGADGKLRDVQLLEARENVANPLVQPAWKRAWQRFWAFVRGYRYGEHEVLLRVIDEVFAKLEDAVLPCFRLVAHLELYLGALAFRDRAAERGLATCLPVMHETPAIDGPPGPLRIERLFNPLLFLQDVTPVPCDVAPAGHDALVLVTGPNSGGKTRLLQALGLAQLLAHAGLFVPAAAAELTRAPAMFVSLVEPGQADQKEGRLGTELMRVRRLFEQLRPGAIVFLDELCSGTNPSEGIAIFEMVLSLLPRLRPQVFLTTHFLDAARALEAKGTTERLEFLQVELDAAGRPTYQFVPGVAPTSLAQQIASRLGVTREELEELVEREEARLRAEAGEAMDAPSEETGRA